jgi:NhaP-type Na+/H+ or K+/H+ antiporter
VSLFRVIPHLGGLRCVPRRADEQHGLDGRAIGYALLGLTVVRMLPVAVALAGTRLRWQTQAFVGWFGPRGLAPVVFLLAALDQLHDTPAATR